MVALLGYVFASNYTHFQGTSLFVCLSWSQELPIELATPNLGFSFKPKNIFLILFTTLDVVDGFHGIKLEFKSLWISDNFIVNLERCSDLNICLSKRSMCVISQLPRHPCQLFYSLIWFSTKFIFRKYFQESWCRILWTFAVFRPLELQDCKISYVKLPIKEQLLFA